MKKRIVALTGTVILFLCSCSNPYISRQNSDINNNEKPTATEGSASTQDETKTVTKTIENVGYAVPDTWDEKQGENNNIIYYYADGYMLTVQCEETALTNEELLSYKDVFVQGLQQSLEDFRNPKAGIGEIDGVGVIEVTGEFTTQGEDCSWNSITFISGKEQYSFAVVNLSAIDCADEYEMVKNSIVIHRDVAENKTGQEKNNEPEKAILLESGWSCAEMMGVNEGLSYAVKIQNPNKEYVIDYATITVTARDAEGKILKTYDELISGIAADDELYYGGCLFYDGKTPADVEISISNSNRNYRLQSNTHYIKQSELKIFNVSENVSQWNRSFTGEITNTSSIDQNFVTIIIIYKKGDDIIGGDTTYLMELEAGDTKAFELTPLFEVTDFDSYDIYAFGN